jgi:hypothetical protein
LTPLKAQTDVCGGYWDNVDARDADAWSVAA